MDATHSLRTATTEDMDFLFALYSGTREEEMSVLSWTAGQKEAFLRWQFAAQHKFYAEHFAGARFDIVELAGRPVGRLYVDRPGDEIRIVDISLLPEYRRQGIGSSLLIDVIAEGKQAGLPVRIHVESFNPALRLYERLGFRHTDGSGVYSQMERAPALK